MEANGSSEMFVLVYRTAQRYIPESRNFKKLAFFFKHEKEEYHYYCIYQLRTIMSQIGYEASCTVNQPLVNHLAY
jgi:hypothetical protein